jgi:predicted RNase H-like HicB family nuclease
MTTTHEYNGYVFTITPCDDGVHTVDFPDIPDIITSGETLTEAFTNACEALDTHLESLQQLNLPTPESRHRVQIQETTG